MKESGNTERNNKATSSRVVCLRFSVVRVARVFFLLFGPRFVRFPLVFAVIVVVRSVGRFFVVFFSFPMSNGRRCRCAALCADWFFFLGQSTMRSPLDSAGRSAAGLCLARKLIDESRTNASTPVEAVREARENPVTTR